ncbi:5-formyltetrahydrofolate cyclo-ligase [Mangrovibacter sp. MFB070]|uniref:5-formyltetrahydrofolate cyclo-ligase n=1 Tax=Mangrovibacter sp. MFB070 TaxID=1224318 RepID=UPI0004D3D7AE|nr:5-formyltetrahydrofolate cyclo-ligase [Mangrovibacter sp. MFB070]KEA54550.1 5-formyltetrahydrofolate cyclo-ligase [Mangrovibacter sp. MFB070]
MQHSPDVSASRQHIRQHIRQIRRALTSHQQQSSAHEAAERFLTWPPAARAQHIGLFLSVDGELNTRPLIERLWAMNRSVYLPVLHPFSAGGLIMVRYEPDTELVVNRLKIPEPRLDVRQILPLQHLDILVTPLVAFDSTGQRLGMGGGFYDRTLQNWREHGFIPVGYAHDCQQVEALPTERWDIPLPTIVTPSKLWVW